MFEPFPGNYVWNLGINLALIAGGNHGELDAVCRPVREGGRAGADAGSAMLFDSWISVADQVTRNAERDEAEGFLLSAGAKFLRASGYYIGAERLQSRDYAPRWVAYDKGLELYHKGCPTKDRATPRSSSTMAAARRALRWSRSTVSIR